MLKFNCPQGDRRYCLRQGQGSTPGLRSAGICQVCPTGIAPCQAKVQVNNQDINLSLQRFIFIQAFYWPAFAHARSARNSSKHWAVRECSPEYACDSLLFIKFVSDFTCNDEFKTKESFGYGNRNENE